MMREWTYRSMVWIVRNSLLVLLPLASVTGLPVTALAQSESRASWETLLAERVRPAYRHTYPKRQDRCVVEPILPDSIALVGGMSQEPIGWTWKPIGLGSQWLPIHESVPTDTFWVRTVEAYCYSAAAPPRVVVERDGYFIELNPKRWAIVSDQGDVTPGAMWMRTGNTLDVAGMYRECSGEQCRWKVLPATSLAAELKEAYEARLAEERRIAEERRRAEEQRLAAERRAAERQRAEKEARLRKLGASDAQVQAGLAGRVVEGMSLEIVREIWGDPIREERSVSELGTKITWYYRSRTLEFVGGQVAVVR